MSVLPAATVPRDHPTPTRGLDPELYGLRGEALAFYRQQTGIEDPEELKQHILSVQAKAYKVYPYPCIRYFSFLKLKISTLPGYKGALELLKTRKDPILLDLGCCFGNDLRKAVSDGWPVHAALGSDLRQGFWDYGYELFKDTPETFPASFLAGDVFDPGFIPDPSHMKTSDSSPLEASNLRSLKTFQPLTQKISAIHASSLFHLFSSDKQLALARILAFSLLSSESGSIIFGRHIANKHCGLKWEESGTQSGGIVEMFCHSPEGWKKMWIEDVFSGNEGSIEVVADLIPAESVNQEAGAGGSFPNVPGDGKRWLMRWYVKRL